MVLKISQSPYSAAYCKGTISVTSGSVLSLAPILFHMVWKTSLFPNQMAKCSWDLGVTRANSFSFSSRINLKIEKRRLHYSKLNTYINFLSFTEPIQPGRSSLYWIWCCSPSFINKMVDNTKFKKKTWNELETLCCRPIL